MKNIERTQSTERDIKKVVGYCTYCNTAIGEGEEYVRYYVGFELFEHLRCYEEEKEC